ncbi:TonB-dependent receptor [Polymorphobacter sp.]|uniref:TonB-dependent receptor n=1 Tax=Polymorphobacter sp. TaxID=1909290 RepID=UPI003F730A99
MGIRVSGTIRLGMAALLASSAAVAIAQEVVANDDEGIIVTGSRILRSDAASVGPITTLTQDDILFTAPTSVGDLIQNLPGVGVSLNNNGTQGTAFGVSSVNLRYLGSAEGSGNRTLVLVDGKRWINAVGGRGFRDFVDLNTIPMGIVDNIEVLKDGASAIYGADAIAGVVNIKTKRKIDGLEANARFGMTDRGDNENISGHVNWGKVGSRASVLVSFTYSNTKPVFTADRALTEVALTPVTAPPTSPRGLFLLPGLANNAYFGTPANFGQNAANAITRLPGVGNTGFGSAADNGFRVARLPDDFYNTQAQGIYSIGPSERYGAFGRVTADIGDSVEFKLEGLYNYRSSSQLFSPFLLDVRGSNGFRISADQAFNPFGTANGVPQANALAFTQNAFRAQRVAVEVGNRDNQQEVKTYRIAGGFEGGFELAGRWNFDVFASWNRNDATFTAQNQINLENVYRALHSPALCAASAGCTPLNIFGEITPQMADYIRYNGFDEQRAEMWNISANVSRTLFNLPGGEVGFAAGYEYRNEKAVDNPDSFANTFSTVLPLVGGMGQLPTTAQAREPTQGRYDLHEVYGEVSLPILADVPGFYRLEVDAAMRYSHYSTVGGRATGKVSTAWQPVRGVMLRGTWAQGFRAPSILELNQGLRQTNFQAVDPCNGGGGNLPGCAGVPTSYNQNQFGSGALAGVTAGNPNLFAETSDSYSLGVAITPPNMSRTSLTVDWFRINVRDAITAQSAAQILSGCATTGNFCDLVRRAPSGEILELRQAVVNLSRIEVEGVDATLRVGFPLGSGNIDTMIDVAYLQRFRTFTPQPNGDVIVDDRAGLSDQPRSTFPRWKGQGSLRWSNDVFGIGWRGRYIGSSADVPNNTLNGGRIKAIIYNDLQASVNVPGTGVRFAVGVDNVLDQQPPASRANNPINFDIYTYDIRGRYLYTTIGLTF